MYYPKQKQSLARMRMFLDVSFIGGDGFQKDYIFLKVEITTVGSKKKKL